MVTKFGMSEKLGPIDYSTSEGDEVFIGRDWGQVKAFSEQTSALIDQEVKEIIDSCYQKAKDLITVHQDVLENCAQLLLAKEKITREEFEALFAPQDPEPTPDQGFSGFDDSDFGGVSISPISI